jgi:hypothetical protein
MKLVNTTSKSLDLAEIVVILASSKKQAAISFVRGYLNNYISLPSKSASIFT